MSELDELYKKNFRDISNKPGESANGKIVNHTDVLKKALSLLPIIYFKSCIRKTINDLKNVQSKTNIS